MPRKYVRKKEGLGLRGESLEENLQLTTDALIATYAKWREFNNIEDTKHNEYLEASFRQALALGVLIGTKERFKER